MNRKNVQWDNGVKRGLIELLMHQLYCTRCGFVFIFLKLLSSMSYNVVFYGTLLTDTITLDRCARNFNDSNKFVCCSCSLCIVIDVVSKKIYLFIHP